MSEVEVRTHIGIYPINARVDRTLLAEGIKRLNIIAKERGLRPGEVRREEGKLPVPQLELELSTHVGSTDYLATLFAVLHARTSDEE